MKMDKKQISTFLDPATVLLYKMVQFINYLYQDLPGSSPSLQ